jgi:putative tryptophan/tyrosine transport system substrate-binding protein
LGLEVEAADIKTADELEPAFAAFATSGVNGITIGPGSLFFRERFTLARLGIKHRLPIMGTSEVMTRDGVLIYYGPNFQNLFRGAATYIDRILKGTKPSELPVQQPSKFELVVNLRTAKQIGLTIPPIFIGRADEVIE